MPGGYHRACCCNIGCPGGPATLPSIYIKKYVNVYTGTTPNLFLEHSPYIRGLTTTVVSNVYNNQFYRLRNNIWEAIIHDNFNIGRTIIAYNTNTKDYFLFGNAIIEPLSLDYQNLLGKLDSSIVYDEIYITPIGFYIHNDLNYNSYEATINAITYDSINNLYYFMEYSVPFNYQSKAIIKIWSFDRSTETWILKRKEDVTTTSNDLSWRQASGIYDPINERYIIAFTSSFPISGYHKIVLYNGLTWQIIAEYEISSDYNIQQPILLYNPDDEKLYIILYVYKSPLKYYHILQLDNNILTEYDIDEAPVDFSTITDITYDTDRHVAVIILRRSKICEYDFITKTFSNFYQLIEEIRELRIIYEPNTQKCIIYGGRISSEPPVYNNQIYIWNGINIENIHDTNMGNLCGNLFYDSEYNDIVLFGGMYSYTNFSNATMQPFANAWYLDNLEWKNITTRPVFNYPFTYNPNYINYQTNVIYMPNIQKFLIFLSHFQCNTFLYDPETNTFEQLFLEIQPTYKTYAYGEITPLKMCYDPNTQKVYLINYIKSAYENRLELWMFDSIINTWTLITQNLLGDYYLVDPQYFYAFAYMYTIDKLLISCQIYVQQPYIEFDMLFSYDTINRKLTPIPVSNGIRYEVDPQTSLFYQNYHVKKATGPIATYKLYNFEDYLLLCMKANIIGITICQGCISNNVQYYQLITNNSEEIIYLKHQGINTNLWKSVKPVYVFKLITYSAANCSGSILKEEIIDFYLTFELIDVGYASLLLQNLGRLIFRNNLFQIPPNENYFIKTVPNTLTGSCPNVLAYGGQITIEGIQ